MDNYFANPEVLRLLDKSPTINTFLCSVKLYYREPRSAVDKKKLESVYSRYKDGSEPDKIGMEGVVRFLEDLQLDPTSR